MESFSLLVLVPSYNILYVVETIKQGAYSTQVQLEDKKKFEEFVSDF